MEALAPQYKQRKLYIREDHIKRLDDIAVKVGTRTSAIIEEALDVYFAFIAKEVEESKKEEVEVTSEEVPEEE